MLRYSWIWTAAPLTVTDPSSWLWTGAGVQRDSIIVAGYGDEVDHRFANGKEPAGVSVIGDAMVEGYDGHFAMGETTLYTAPSGALVFSAGSIGWSGLLSCPGRWDARVQQLVANLFSRFAGDGALGPAALRPISLPPGARAPSYRAGAQVSTVTSALLQPTAVAAAPNGDAIVLDQNRVVRVTPAGAVTPIAGGPAGFADGPADAARFREPRGLAVAANGDIFVADTANNRIRVISRGMVRTLAGSQRGYAEGTGAQALFAQPMALALTAAGTVLVADTWNQRLREVTLAGQVSTWAGDGQILSADGPGAQASLNYPLALALLPGGDVVLAEPATGRLRRVAGASPHAVSGLAGALGFEGYDDGAASSAGVSETLALTARPDGQVILVDGATSRVRALKAGAVDTLAGGTRGGTADGAGATAGFAFPRGVGSAPDGSLLVVDAREHTLRRIVLAP